MPIASYLAMPLAKREISQLDRIKQIMITLEWFSKAQVSNEILPKNNCLSVVTMLSTLPRADLCKENYNLRNPSRLPSCVGYGQ